MLRSHLTVIAGLGLLAGCTGNSDFSFSDPGSSSYNAVVSGFENLQDAFDLSLITPTGSIPDIGDAVHYDGYMRLHASDHVSGEREEYAGDARLTANFEMDTVGGSASNFFDSSNRSVSGTLALSAGTIDRTADPSTEWQIGADIDGVLTDGDGVDLEVSASLVGDFLGPEAQGYESEIIGTMLSAYGNEILIGASIGER